MKKKILVLCMAAFAMLVFAFASTAAAEDVFVSGGFTYVLLSDNTASITGCSMYGDITIPSKIDGYTVTNLAAKLFYGEYSVTSVSIPATVTYFGTDSGDNMWDYVFSYCFSLKSINVDKNNPSFCSVDGVLYNKQKTVLINYPCSKDGATYHVPESVSTLCCTSFASSQNLTKLYLDGTGTWWYTYTFYNDGDMTVYYLPGGNTEYKAQSEISGGRSHETNQSRPVFAMMKPVISSQPESATVEAGDTATFKVTAKGAAGYQWYYRTSSSGSWTAVKNNGTSATYSLVTEARHNGYQYRCRVKNSAGSVYSGVVTLTVQGKPVITAQPKSVTVAEGGTATFKVTADGATGYQWYYRTSSSGSWTAVKKNGTSAAYSLVTEARHNGYQYRCRANNSSGSVYSGIVTLTVQTKPVVTAQPKSVTVAEGGTATFKVTATGGGLSYQWYYRTSSSGSWTAVRNNGTSSAYNLVTESRHNGFQYRCKVTNKAGSVYSGIVTLTVQTKPVITGQPKSASIAAGSVATFKVAATGGGLSYQWYYRTSSSGSWTAVKNNGTSSTYNLTTETRHNGYQYRCKVTNKAGSVYSGIVTLTVK